jgi:type VI secretion system secreted protein Hcp
MMRRTGFRELVAAGVVATGVIMSTSVVAASDMFLKITNITGESMDEKHKGEIDVLSWSWGESTGTARTSRGAAPAVCIQDLSFTKLIDSASPGLIMMGMTGQMAPDAALVVRKAGERGQEYFRLRMTNVSVLSFQTGGSSGDGILAENVVLRFESLKGEYFPQKADGSLGQAVTFEVSGGACR